MVSGKFLEDRVRFVECLYPPPLGEERTTKVRPNVGRGIALQRFIKVADGLHERWLRARTTSLLTMTQRRVAVSEIEMVGPSVGFRYLR